MALVEAHTQIPLYPPLFKGGSFVPGLYPSLEKRGKGRFLGGVRVELYRELLGHHTSRAPNKWAQKSQSESSWAFSLLWCSSVIHLPSHPGEKSGGGAVLRERTTPVELCRNI